MQTFRNFGVDSHMEFRLDNCRNTVLKTGKFVHSQNVILDISIEIQEPEQGKHTSTLGLRKVEAYNINKWKKLEQEYSRRLRMILKSELNAKNKITVLQY